MRKVALLWLPFPVEENQATMKVISKQNGLDTSKWKIISSSTCANRVGEDLVVAVDEESLANIKDLKESIRFGFSTRNLSFPIEPKNSTKGAASSARSFAPL